MYAQIIEYEVLIIKNNYYVYEHIRLDDNTCIYVGKGSGKRAWTKARNLLHDEIVDKVGIRVNIIQGNLSEEEAFNLERETILKYLDEGYGIDIIGMDDSTKIGFLTNQALGGRGVMDQFVPKNGRSSILWICWAKIIPRMVLIIGEKETPTKIID